MPRTTDPHAPSSPSPTPIAAVYDVVIVGGGAAGLGAALALARARRSVLVVDAGEPRNAPADGVHNYLGREGVPPRELVAIGREEVRGYGGEVVEGRVAAVRRLTDGPGDPAGGPGAPANVAAGAPRFRLTMAGGPPVDARRLVLATGLVDELPDVPGVAERWGRDVLHCPYCHGWEARDQPIAILATTPLAVHQALLWRQWSPDVTLVLHDAPAPGPGDAAKLAAVGVAVVDGPAAALETEAGGDRLSGLRLADGRLVPCRRLAVAPRFVARADLLDDLGLELAEHEMDGVTIARQVPADATGATAVPGVWVAGNVAEPMATVISSAAAGVRAAQMVNVDLVEEDVAAAVARAGAAA